MDTYKVCAWDVGIKTLSYCVIEVDKENFKICNMGIIDITSEDKNYCSAITKNNKTCNKLAKFSGLLLGGNINYYCGTHKIMHKECSKINETELVINIASQVQCSHNKCKIKSKFEVFNKALCLTHKNMEIKNYKKKYEVNKVNKVKCYGADLVHLGESMYSKLDLIPDIFVHNVYIENQPSMKSPTMKSISMLLFSYFVMKKKESKVNTIKFIAPSGKLKVDENVAEMLINKSLQDEKIIKVLKNIEEFVKIPDIQKLIIKSIINKALFDKEILDRKLECGTLILDNKYVYELTKLLSIKYAEIIVEKHGPEWKTYINSLKKKDDVADAILHALKKKDIKN